MPHPSQQRNPPPETRFFVPQQLAKTTYTPKLLKVSEELPGFPMLGHLLGVEQLLHLCHQGAEVLCSKALQLSCNDRPFPKPFVSCTFWLRTAGFVGHVLTF